MNFPRYCTHLNSCRVVPVSAVENKRSAESCSSAVSDSAETRSSSSDSLGQTEGQGSDSGKPEKSSNRVWRSRTGRARRGRRWISRDEQLALEHEAKQQDSSLAAMDRWRIQERVNAMRSTDSADLDDDTVFQSNIISLITSPNAVELTPAPVTEQRRRRPPVTDDGKYKPEASGRELLLQGFNWESHREPWYQVLGDKAESLSEAGFTLVWLPPPSQSVSDEGYMPGDYYNLNSKYGSLEELKLCLNKVHRAGLSALADIVINHRCAQRQDNNGVWNIYGGKMAWDQRAIVGDDPNFCGQGNHSTGTIFHAAPNIDHQQEFVRQDIKEWLHWLKNEVGYDGWRFDFTKGYGGQFVGEYVEETMPLFSVGEFWDTLSYSGGYLDYDQNPHRQRTVDWINATGGRSLAFDMTTKGILHAVIENNEYWRLSDPEGKPPGVLGWWPSKTCTFIENHDTGSTQGHWRFPDHGVEQGYAYILTHPGTPTVFWDHYFAPQWQPAIRRLMEIRRENGISCRSQVHILKADSGVYAAQIDDRVIVKLGPRDWSPGDSSWEMAGFGHHWCVWVLDKPSRDVMDTVLTASFHEDPASKLFTPPRILHQD
eukprot:CAMPEP_0177594508 /NCGR_PEP_ID=MMETSP0419_2-20121207/9820_1 /TAXON_ID=582737 /ORGANISM="Tetraselmis sp., Strain GSL018" /LENGTH=598 /DNA_ID=CAMNT_0019085825 /DNA_START=592 /DNA_END=2388 /DNA_ORIENTATION=-